MKSREKWRITVWYKLHEKYWQHFLSIVTPTDAALDRLQARSHSTSPGLHTHPGEKGPHLPMDSVGHTCTQAYLVLLCFALLCLYYNKINFCLHQQSNCDSLYCNICFIAVVCHWTWNISEVCMYIGSMKAKS